MKRGPDDDSIQPQTDPARLDSGLKTVQHAIKGLRTDNGGPNLHQRKVRLVQDGVLASCCMALSRPSTGGPAIDKGSLSAGNPHAKNSRDLYSASGERPTDVNQRPVAPIVAF
jgi:hypothetical protein